MLECRLQTIPDWREALVYGDLIGYVDYPMPDGNIRHTRWQIYRKRLIVFVYVYWHERNPAEPNAWHGCGMYDYSEYFP